MATVKVVENKAPHIYLKNNIEAESFFIIAYSILLYGTVLYRTV